ncbi:MAG: thioredoxin family protein [Bacteroidaceae bacterium]|nr:thioredoxin family protein [Prevotellaceae bacterium]MDY5631260.1 thioredoxin family protein [Bacteroidaceae bacterium]
MPIPKALMTVLLPLLFLSCEGRRGSLRIDARLKNIDQADLLILSTDGGLSDIDTLHLVKGRAQHDIALQGGPYTFIILYPNMAGIRFMASEGQTVKVRGDVLQTGREEITGCDSILPPDTLIQTLPLKVGRAMPKDSVLNASRRAGKPLLVAFWANWKSGSNIAQRNLRDAHTTYGDSIAMLLYSLDVDEKMYKAAWRDPQSPWKEHCDLRGFQSPLARKLKITKLPYFILVNAQGRIQGHGSNYDRDIKPQLSKK